MEPTTVAPVPAVAPATKGSSRTDGDLAGREAELNRREAELRRLEMELRNNPAAKVCAVLLGGSGRGAAGKA